MNTNTISLVQHNFRSSLVGFDSFMNYYSNDADIIFANDIPLSIKRGRKIDNYEVVLPNTEIEFIETALLIKSTLDFTRTYSKCGRLVAVTFETPSAKFALISVYIRHTTGEGLDELVSLVNLFENDGINCIIAGDMNARSNLWGPSSVTSNANGRRIEELIDQNQLCILNTYPCDATYFSSTGSKSWIDVSLCSSKCCHLVESWSSRQRSDGLSDHSIVSFELYESLEAQKPDQRPNWRNAEWDSIYLAVYTKLLNMGWFTFDWNWISDVDSFDKTVENLQSDICSVALPMAPCRRRKGTRKHFWNDNLTNYHRKLRKAQRKVHRRKAKDREVSQDLKLSLRRAKKDFHEAFIEARNSSWNSFLNGTSKADMWKNLQRISGKKQQVDPSFVIDQNGEVITNTNEIIEALFDKFLPRNQPSNGEQLDNTRSEHDSDAIPPEVTISEVQHAVFAGKEFGSCGSDLIPNKLLRVCWPFLGELLRQMISTSFRLKHCCAIWKHSLLIAVPKRSDHQNRVSNLRPISLLSVVSKVAEKVAVVRISFDLESKMKLSPRQYGFRRHFSTEEALLNITKSMENSLNKGHFVCSSSLDISAAFDSVNHKILLDRMRELEIPTYLVQWTGSFLTKRTARIEIQQSWKERPILAGCPQGSPLSPLLFDIYLNSLLSSFDGQDPPSLDGRRTRIQAYADDIFVWSSHESHTMATNNLQECLNYVSEWCDASCFALNPAKCLVIQFAKPRKKVPKLDIFLGGQLLQESSNCKYLGVMLDSHLKWSYHINFLKQKVMNRLIEFRRFSNKNGGFSPDLSARIFKGAIEPAIYYGASVWSRSLDFPNSLKPIEKIIRQFGLQISGCLRTTSYPSTYLLSGITPPSIKLSELTLSTGLRLLSYGKEDLVLNKKSERTCNSSFQRIFKSTLKEVSKNDAFQSLLQVGRIIPRSIPPHDSDNLIKEGSSLDLSLFGNAATIYFYSSACTKCFVFTWCVRSLGSAKEGFLIFHKASCKKFVELSGLRHILQQLPSSLEELSIPFPCPIFLIGQRPSILKELRKSSNMIHPCELVQSIILEMEKSGFRLYWLRASKSIDMSPFMRLKCLANSNQIRNQSEENLICADENQRIARISTFINKKTQDYVHNYDSVGRALLDLKLPHSSFFPCRDLPRRDASRLSQFLASHFPSVPYFDRFKIDASNGSRSCGCLLYSNMSCSRYRDHLLFQCPDFASQRLALLDQLAIDTLTWDDIFENPASCIDFINQLF